MSLKNLMYSDCSGDKLCGGTVISYNSRASWDRTMDQCINFSQKDGECMAICVNAVYEPRYGKHKCVPPESRLLMKLESI